MTRVEYVRCLKLDADELAREVQRLTRYGKSAQDIALQLRISMRTVTRHRKRVLTS